MAYLASICTLVGGKGGGHHHKPEVHAETPFTGEKPDIGKNSEGIFSAKDAEGLEKIREDES